MNYVLCSIPNTLHILALCMFTQHIHMYSMHNIRTCAIYYLIFLYNIHIHYTHTHLGSKQTYILCTNQSICLPEILPHHTRVASHTTGDCYICFKERCTSHLSLQRIPSDCTHSHRCLNTLTHLGSSPNPRELQSF